MATQHANSDPKNVSGIFFIFCHIKNVYEKCYLFMWDYFFFPFSFVCLSTKVMDGMLTEDSLLPASNVVKIYF